uniref:Uncharacterized protein n=1 Tax=Oryza nivara TaxID=4536 RepID=A0A0E0H545_ORYNI
MELEEEKDPPKHQSKIKMNSAEIKKRKIGLGKDQGSEKKEMSGKNIKSIKETGTKGQSKELQKEESKSRKSTKDKSKKNKDMTQVQANAEEFHKEYTTKVIRKESRTGNKDNGQSGRSISLDTKKGNKDNGQAGRSISMDTEIIGRSISLDTGNKDNKDAERSIQPGNIQNMTQLVLTEHNANTLISGKKHN